MTTSDSPPTKSGAADAPREYLTEGPVTKALIRLAWPIIAMMLLQTAYNIVDTIWVGRLGPEAVAAISVSFPVVLLVITIAGGVTSAGAALVAQYTGARDQAMANRVAGQTFISVMSLAIVLSALGITFSRTLLIWIGAGPDVLEEAVSYLTILLAGLVFPFMFFIFASVLRGWGDSLTALKFKLASTTINIALDPLLIFGLWGFPALGVAGAAWATVIAQMGTGVLGMALLFRGRYGIHIRPGDLVPDWVTIRRIFRIGIPSAIEQSARAMSLTLMTGTVALFGTYALAAYGIGNRILSLAFMPAIGMAAATTTLVGQNLGAGKAGRAAKAAWTSIGLTFAALAGFGLMLYSAPRTFILIFNDHPEVLATGVPFLQVVGLSFGFIGTVLVISGAFRGAGTGVPAMILSVGISVLQIPLALFLALYMGWGTSGVWWAIFTASFLGAVVGALWFGRGTWRHAAVVQVPAAASQGSSGGGESYHRPDTVEPAAR